MYEHRRNTFDRMTIKWKKKKIAKFCDEVLFDSIAIKFRKNLKICGCLFLFL